MCHSSTLLLSDVGAQELETRDACINPYKQGSMSVVMLLMSILAGPPGSGEASVASVLV